MSVPSPEQEDVPLLERIRRNPRPALVWAAVFVFLISLEIGALIHFGFELLHVILKTIPGAPGIGWAMDGIKAAGDIPTLLSRELIANQGYYNGERWVGTFLSLEPKWAWLARVGLVFLYGFVVLYWMWRGYVTYRNHYRFADWTPRDDQIDRFSRHTWGKFGLAMVFAFLMMAMFAPTLSPTTFQQNIKEPYSYTTKYWDEDAETVKEIRIGLANLRSASQGSPNQNVGPWSYDQYGRFHPFGTLTSGKDLFTFMMFGSRISLFIGLSSIAIAGA
ncbi:MAG: ABC transporter permease, partial [Halodesulfurarchaeum sp.]